jgi:hypothetical protein
VPRRIRDKFKDGKSADMYFASQSDPGPRRALENLHESAWYNGRQTYVMFWMYTIAIGTLLIMSVVALVIASRHMESAGSRESTIKVVTASLMLVVSLNMLKSAWSYLKMYQRCLRTEESTLRLIESPMSESDALRQWHEYQVARSSCPLIPQWLWKLMEESMNDAWRSSRVATSNRQLR